jgi:hypothetical protein
MTDRNPASYRRRPRPLLLTALAVKPQKAIGQNPATNIGLKLLTDKVRYRTAFHRPLSCKGLQLLLDNLITGRLTGIASSVQWFGWRMTNRLHTLASTFASTLTRELQSSAQCARKGNLLQPARRNPGSELRATTRPRLRPQSRDCRYRPVEHCLHRACHPCPKHPGPQGRPLVAPISVTAWVGTHQPDRR